MRFYGIVGVLGIGWMVALGSLAGFATITALRLGASTVRVRDLFRISVLR
jgi:hypothetical protein